MNVLIIEEIFQIENQLTNDDVGRDLTSVQNMLKKQQLLENDIANHEVKIHRDEIERINLIVNVVVERHYRIE